MLGRSLYSGSMGGKYRPEIGLFRRGNSLLMMRNAWAWGERTMKYNVSIKRVFTRIVHFGVLLLFVVVTSAGASGPEDSGDLKGTFWVANKEHTRSTVDINGEVSVKEGKEIYVEFMEWVDGAYSTRSTDRSDLSATGEITG
jgi:hypothetical protein